MARVLEKQAETIQQLQEGQQNLSKRLELLEREVLRQQKLLEAGRGPIAELQSTTASSSGQQRTAPMPPPTASVLLDRQARNAPFTDRTLICRDCGREFVFTMGEQEFFAQKGFTNEPGRCPECRAVRKARAYRNTAAPRPHPTVSLRDLALVC
jgi:hypothetical protein